MGNINIKITLTFLNPDLRITTIKLRKINMRDNAIEVRILNGTDLIEASEWNWGEVRESSRTYDRRWHQGRDDPGTNTLVL